MRTISDSDWHEIEKGIRKLMESTLSRSEFKKFADLLAKIESEQAKTYNPYNYPTVTL